MLVPLRYRRTAKHEMDFIGWLTEHGLRRADRRKDAAPAVTYMPTYRAGWCDDQERDRELRAAEAKEERRRRKIEEDAFARAFRYFRGETTEIPWTPRRPGPLPKIPDAALGPVALAKRMKQRAYTAAYRQKKIKRRQTRITRAMRRKLFEAEMARFSWPSLQSQLAERALAKEQTDNWFKRQRSPV